MAIRERELGTIGPILSDGTPVGDLIDVERREASLRLFHDPEVWELEQKNLFAKSWIILGHETEIPEAGDYVMRQLAADPVVVTRDRDGNIQVLLNVCTHRGMQVCRSECGNTNSFKCVYHGWLFGNDGNLLGAPFERDMYGADWDKQELRLRRARVDTYAGIIFANWDWEAPPLEEFLGDYAWYLDTIFKRTKRGLEMVGAPQRFVIKSNWKAAAEQFNGADGYHAVTLHRSLMDMFVAGSGSDFQTVARMLMDAVDIGCHEGHGLRAIGFKMHADRMLAEAGITPEQMETMSPIELLTLVPPDSLPVELVPELLETMTEGQLRAMTTFAPGPGGLFPNGAFLSTQLRTWTPIGVDKFQLVNFPLVEKDSSPQYKALARKQMLFGFGTSGTIEQDDAEAWPAIQTSANGYMGRQEKMRYRGFSDGAPPEDGWGGGAETYTGFSKDDSAWNWWLRYRDYMTESAW